MRWAPLLLALSACESVPTTLFLEIDGPKTLTGVDVSVGVEGGNTITRKLPFSNGSANLPGTVLVVLPDRAISVTLDVVGHGAGADLTAHTVVTSRPHEQIKVPILLEGELPDLGEDFAAAPPDLADLATASPDFADAAVAPPTVRLISSAYNSSAAASPTGMTATAYTISTSGVVDGDLLIFLANIDNGSTSVWPNPVAPGFTQLTQIYYGTDGQTYVVAWKFASSEPAQYSGTYGSGLGSGAAVLHLIAVTNANKTTPINAFVTSNGGNTAMASPVIATTAGVTTTAANCAIIFVAGSDWLGSPGSNTFSVPTGFTSLAQLGDHGNLAWDWSSQIVAWKLQPLAAATGTISSTLTATTSGIHFSAVIAVAPQ